MRDSTSSALVSGLRVRVRARERRFALGRIASTRDRKRGKTKRYIANQSCLLRQGSKRRGRPDAGAGR